MFLQLLVFLVRYWEKEASSLPSFASCTCRESGYTVYMSNWELGAGRESALSSKCAATRSGVGPLCWWAPPTFPCLQTNRKWVRGRGPSQYPKFSHNSKKLHSISQLNKTFLVCFFTLSLCAFLLLLPHLCISSTFQRDSSHCSSDIGFFLLSRFPFPNWVTWLVSPSQEASSLEFWCVCLCRPHSLSLVLSYSIWFFISLCF